MDIRFVLICLALAVLFTFAVPFSAHSAIVATLTYDVPTGTVRPNETIIIHSTLTNTLSSTENITKAFGGGFSSSFVESQYDFSENNLPPDGKSLGEQFDDIDLMPGQSFQFVFGKFIPRDGTAALGTYEIFTNQFAVGGPVTTREELFFDGNFVRTVIPIPSAAWLFGSALGLLGWLKRKQA